MMQTETMKKGSLFTNPLFNSPRRDRVQCPRTKRHVFGAAYTEVHHLVHVFVTKYALQLHLIGYFFAYESVMECVGLILNPCSPESATALFALESNSTNAIPGFASIIRVSLNPGNCWNSMESMLAVVASVFWGGYVVGNS